MQNIVQPNVAKRRKKNWRRNGDQIFGKEKNCTKEFARSAGKIFSQDLGTQNIVQGNVTTRRISAGEMKQSRKKFLGAANVMRAGKNLRGNLRMKNFAVTGVE